MLSEIPLTVIVPGADDADTVQMLIDMGCEMIQGTDDCSE